MNVDIVASIVNQLFDLAEVPVKKRREINYKADDFVRDLIYPRLEILDPVKIVDTKHVFEEEKTIKELIYEGWIDGYNDGLRVGEQHNQDLVEKIEGIKSDSVSAGFSSISSGYGYTEGYEQAKNDVIKIIKEEK